MPEPSDSKYVLLILFIYLKIVQKRVLKRTRTEGELFQVQQHFLTKFSIKKITLFQISDG